MAGRFGLEERRFGEGAISPTGKSSAMPEVQREGASPITLDNFKLDLRNLRNSGHGMQN